MRIKISYLLYLAFLFSCKKTTTIEQQNNPIPTLITATAQEKTITVKTTSGSTVLNLSLKIKKNDSLIVMAKMDSLGNLKYTLPLNTILTFEVHKTLLNNSSPIYTTSYSIINSSANIDIFLNNVQNIYTFKGAVTECANNNAIQNGIAILKAENDPSKEYNLPIVNGNYNASLIFDNYDFVALIKAKNYVNNQVSIDTGFIAKKNIDNVINLKLCTDYPTLYYNYSFDNNIKNYTNTNNNLSYPFISGSPYSNFDPNTTFYVSAGLNVGAQFAASVGEVGYFIGCGFSIIYIDNVPYLWDYNYISQYLSITRYDINRYGIIEGVADFRVKDFNSVLHHFHCNFKIRKS
jgi:hypothetical protein